MARRGMVRNGAIALAVLVPMVVPAHVAADDDDRRAFAPGAPGVGDPYFPLDGNGGYDVRHYDLDITYDPATDVLQGVATIRAVATQHLSAFNLDLQGLDVHSVRVDDRRADFSRDGNELTITPRRGLRNRRPFDVVVEYSGIPETIVDLFGVSGFVHTDDGALIVGQPHVAATWFPVNDHPSDAASYSIDLRVPAGLEAVANGVLTGTRTRRGWTTWSWYAKEPMASYLVGGAIGELEIDAYRADGIRYWDAIDPDLLTPVAVPVEGTNMLLSGFSEPRYQRLMRTIEVPAGGATLTFWATYDIELDWDFLFVEARTAVPALDDWTTLEAVGVTSPNTGSSCPSWHALHPMVARYQGEDCTQPTWHAVTGRSGWKQWTIDLSPYAGSSVELAISYAGDESVSGLGVAIDDIVVSTGEGTTSFEEDGDTLDGWTIAGPPAGSPDNQSEWFVGSVADLPPPVGAIAQQAFARQPEIVDFLSAYFGRYPWRASGGIVDDAAEITFALENQTRPIYSTVFFNDPIDAELVVVHELAHQWTGDQLRVERWQDIWLNEGFATYMEWLWLEREGLSTTQNVFDDLATFIPADDPWWQITIGDPGPDAMFEFPVYFRGAMTLHALRQQIGDDAFFTLVRRWIRSQAGGTVNTAAFIDLAERVSGQQLDDLFTTWLYTPEKPAGIEPVPVAPPDARVATTSAAAAEAGSRAWIRTAPDVIRALFARHATH